MLRGAAGSSTPCPAASHGRHDRRGRRRRAGVPRRQRLPLVLGQFGGPRRARHHPRHPRPARRGDRAGRRRASRPGMLYETAAPSTRGRSWRCDDHDADRDARSSAPSPRTRHRGDRAVDMAFDELGLAAFQRARSAAAGAAAPRRRALDRQEHRRRRGEPRAGRARGRARRRCVDTVAADGRHQAHGRRRDRRVHGRDAASIRQRVECRPDLAPRRS